MSVNPAARPRGNPQFDDLSLHFGEHLTDLAALVDGWEVLLLADPLEREAVAAFAAGRTMGWQAVVAAMGYDGNDEFVHDAAKSWALADIASKLDNPGERDLVLDFAAESMATPVRLPRRLRPLAVLAALSRRSLRQGGTALMSGRSSALTALRAGMFGR
ncbi:hypothetical protein [Erythrobacter mangrovi]|uniref:Uncharacterized protein n=1 Tax=Erythrobacter mangrovi TaxID=2739433 RepID=A0A7D4AU30_9SPHN|nr:hypothetical protein [Erythrobacter mangrovi]QKG71617.1 hypothetical protein HQR01_09725 [Erythrobacter mangrovi]